MGSIAVRKFRHKEDKNRYKVVLEVETEDNIVAEASYKYLIDVAKGMSASLDEFMTDLKDGD